MKKRLQRVFAFAFGIAFAPLWLLLWIFTGNNMMFTLLNFAADGDN